MKGRRRIFQIKNYSKIIKKKLENGQFQEIYTTTNKIQGNTSEKMMLEDHPKQLPNEYFQDQFEDQYQNQEDVWESIEDSNEEEQEEEGTMQTQNEKSNKLNESKNYPEVYLSNNKNLQKGQILQFDNKAYDMLHRLNVEWPSLSIDFISKNTPFEQKKEFQSMTQYPYEIYTVQGSCNGSKNNTIYLTKWSKLHKTRWDDDPQIEDSDDGSIMNDQDAEIFVQQIATNYDVNRIRALNNSPLIAYWSDLGSIGGEVQIMNTSQQFQRLQNNINCKKRQKCASICMPYTYSGFALNWNPSNLGQLAWGAMDGSIHLYQNDQNFTNWKQIQSYKYHQSSVEDIVYSPTQSYVLASCSSDGTLQIIDTRIKNMNKPEIKINAHKKDVNVCDWNNLAQHLIVTGSDDCSVKIWDLRVCTESNTQELLCFNWHTEPITSVCFEPGQQSIIAVSSEDNHLSIWDMSMQNNEPIRQNIPNQMMFLHQGQEEIKQIKFHPIYNEMLISSALNNINIFKPNYIEDQQEDNDQQDLKKPPIREKDLDQYLKNMHIS